MQKINNTNVCTEHEVRAAGYAILKKQREIYHGGLRDKVVRVNDIIEAFKKLGIDIEEKIEF